ncbi:MAG: class I SAM-dependent methyltransferase [Parvibaculaceae bacterium]
MKNFKPEESFLGEDALRYDDDLRGDEIETIRFLKDLANGRDCLELAIGTGRIGLLLAQEGLVVDGIELSADMIKVLRGKAGGDGLNVVQGDMTSAAMGRRYGLVYLVFNSIGNVLTQDGQVKCFENAARHLEPDGAFVLECRVPTAPKRDESGFMEIYDVALDVAHIGACRYDPISQILDLQHVHIRRDGIRLAPIRLRLANPPEFDLMARCAGLTLEARYGGWQLEPFDARSWRHVSVYKPA